MVKYAEYSERWKSELYKWKGNEIKKVLSVNCSPFSLCISFVCSLGCPIFSIAFCDMTVQLYVKRKHEE